MAKQVKAEPTKLTSRLSHHGLITLLIKDALRKRQIEWSFFLFWNGFSTELDKKGKKLSPRSSARKRRVVSMPPEQEPQPPSKSKRPRKRLSFDKEQAANNPLNLPYFDSGSEAEQPTTGGEEQGGDLPTPTPPEETDLNKGKQPAESDTGLPPSTAGPSNEPSPSSDTKINQMFKDLHDAKQAEKELKTEKAELIGRNLAMYDIYKEMKGKFDKVLERNKMLMRDNVSLYRKVRMLRLQVKEMQAPAAQSSGLEALAEVAEAMEETAERKAPVPVEKKKGQGTKKKALKPMEKKKGKEAKKKTPEPLEKKKRSEGAKQKETPPLIRRRSPRTRS